MGDRSYSAATEAAIFAVSLKCYYPGCTIPSVSFLGDNTQKKNVQIAHIVAVSPEGPRYRPISKADRDDFENLILLCGGHHPRVDKKSNEHEYTEELLREWKQENEKGIRSKIDGIDRLTEERLNEMLTTAAESTKDEILASLEDLKDVSEGAAELLRSLFEEIENHYIDSDSIEMLYMASERLSFLEEGSAQLHQASVNLGDLESNSNAMINAADKISSIDIGELLSFSQKLEQLNDDYASVIRNSPDISDISSSIESAGRSAISDINGSIESAGKAVVAEIEKKSKLIDIGERPVYVDHEQRWKFGLVGFMLGVLAVLVTVIILASNGVI
ncbi:hypothetical protein FHR84_000526 [Actinopolyspora biskrensis]|uniref:HNH endonuclease n=1 Tax=Actinopolyspora biskrensis TaxID=1470178 RepID=A0A852YU04_9ACTN|nr:HNH endonuclease signature motif containing protein [Actinopolyspora biskrensis]NYH77212.1 hypothetical protein [Actinopolyspora biskrensis]